MQLYSVNLYKKQVTISVLSNLDNILINYKQRNQIKFRYWFLCMYNIVSDAALNAHTEKSSRNPVKSNPNQIVLTISRFWNKKDVRLVPESVHGKYNLIWVWFNMFTKIFLRVLHVSYLVWLIARHSLTHIHTKELKYISLDCVLLYFGIAYWDYFLCIYSKIYCFYLNACPTEKKRLQKRCNLQKKYIEDFQNIKVTKI